ncbi:MAG TPA: diguanylate cyclase [Gemmatimonadales bacterium]|jgi:two-component system cell cycle response regulator
MSDSPQKILVADDDRALLKTLTTILTSKGYQVEPLESGENLLAILELERPDLLMLDIMMPKVDGLQLLAQVKADRRYADLPVLMISSMLPEEATVRSLGLGANDFISKPFRVKELLARVEAHLRVGAALRAVRREAEQQAKEAATHAEMLDILHEVTDALAPEEIYHILTRRVANVLRVGRCSVVLAKSGDSVGTVVTASENPMLRNLDVRLDRYPEIGRALETNHPVLVRDVATDPLYNDVRQEWAREGVTVATRSAITVPFGLQEQQTGVFFVRTLQSEAPLTERDVQFASRAVETAINAVEKAYQLQSAESDKLRYRWLATTDVLTGCLNRRALTERLESELKRLRRYGLALSILMIDVDRFKTINDTLGHLVGDRVLQQVGKLLRDEVREVDAVARYGGEEFVVLLPETDRDGAAQFAERIRVSVERHDFSDGQTPLHATVSVGVASTLATDLRHPDTLIKQADEALYRAKRDGRNLVRI